MASLYQICEGICNQQKVLLIAMFQRLYVRLNVYILVVLFRLFIFLVLWPFQDEMTDETNVGDWIFFYYQF